MAEITVSGSERLEQARAILANIEGGYESAFREALKKTTRRVSTCAATEIRRQYDINKREVKKNSESKSVVYSHQLGVRAELTFAGHKIPLHKFGGSAPASPMQDRSRGRVPVKADGDVGIDGTEHWYYPGVAARGHQLGSTSPTVLEGAFVAKMPNGHIGIFRRIAAFKGHDGRMERDGSKLQEIMGGSVAQMLENEEVSAALEREAKEVFDAEIDKQVQKKLEGKSK